MNVEYKAGGWRVVTGKPCQAAMACQTVWWCKTSKVRGACFSADEVLVDLSTFKVVIALDEVQMDLLFRSCLPH